MARSPLDTSPLSSHYATFRKEKLGPRVSLKMMQMLKEGQADDTRSIISGFTDGSLKGDAGLRQGVSFNRLPVRVEAHHEVDWIEEPDQDADQETDQTVVRAESEHA